MSELVYGEFLPYSLRSKKVICTVCGRTGYLPGSWQDGCRRGHLPCLDCGEYLTVKLDGTRRVHRWCIARLNKEEA